MYKAGDIIRLKDKNVVRVGREKFRKEDVEGVIYVQKEDTFIFSSLRKDDVLKLHDGLAQVIEEGFESIKVRYINYDPLESMVVEITNPLDIVEYVAFNPGDQILTWFGTAVVASPGLKDGKVKIKTHTDADYLYEINEVSLEEIEDVISCELFQDKKIA